MLLIDCAIPCKLLNLSFLNLFISKMEITITLYRAPGVIKWDNVVKALDTQWEVSNACCFVVTDAGYTTVIAASQTPWAPNHPCANSWH